MLYQMLIQGAVFLLFFILVKKFFYDKVVEIIDKRQSIITDEFDKAENEYLKANALKQEYENKVKSINEEALAITNNATKEAKEIRENIISQANEEARKIKAKSKKDIETAKETAMKEMQENFEGFFPGVIAVLHASKTGELTGISDAFASLRSK